MPSGRHELTRRFILENQRERILDAVALTVAERGYEKLSIPAIAKRASVSHQTFYEMFPTKQDALLATLRLGVSRTLQVSAQAYQRQGGDWPAAVAAGLHTLLVHLAAEPQHARLGFVEALAGGPAALRVREQSLQAFAAYIDPGFELAPAVPRVTGEAIAGGIWQLIHLQVARGCTEELPLLAPMLVYATLTPFLGAREAARVARRKPPR